MTEKTDKALTVYRRPNRQVMAVAATRPVPFITESEVYALADAARTGRHGERDYLMVMVLFQGALRINEAVGLHVRDKHSVEGKHLLAVLGKGNKPRLVAIPERLSHALGDYAYQNALEQDGRFFPITRQRAWQIIRSAAGKAGIDRRVYCHLLRHGGALARLRRTGHPKSLQTFLGHSDFKMTMRYLSTLQVAESLEIESQVEFER